VRRTAAHVPVGPAGGMPVPGESTRILAAPGITRVAAVTILLGVLGQAVVAGGFLAGRAGLRQLHEYLGYSLLVIAVVVLVAGLLGHRSKPESLTAVATRVALVVAVADAVFAGMRASRGTTDLLMLHIPLAFAVTGLAARLLTVRHVRPRALESWWHETRPHRTAPDRRVVED
jgi:hypothetical protein